MMPLFLVGVFSYGSVLAYYYALDRIDVSVVNAAWSLQSVYVAVLAFLILGEQWTELQAGGVGLILLGVFALFFWHKHVSILHTFLLLSLVAIPYIPSFFVQKAAMSTGATLASTIFFSRIGRDAFAVLLPFAHPRLRRSLAPLFARASASFLLLNASSAVLSLIAIAFSVTAFTAGPLSLVSIIGNAQPFFTILIASLLLAFSPTYAPRELLTAQSVSVKLTSFGIVFLGLALLAVG
jgi:drug/metabolite transporter (DMT)-like permease